ncbi:MAG: hypothetical protein HY922_16510 [Elusimicrobia bacterium]|nr:hypothetical protein [Elusimicrobiota bacterium]
MKNFDALQWLRNLRDAHFQDEKELTPDQKIAASRKQAESFRASRPLRKSS